MTTGSGVARLGAQLWLERDSTPAEIERLMVAAVDSGLGLLRIFLVWPWIEPEPDSWDFDLYDEVFAAAARHGLLVKATLSPETSPWHEGTPGFVQSGHVGLPTGAERRGPIRRYLAACVERYRDHPALAQWILWNEPVNAVVPPGRPNPHRGDELRGRWAELLSTRYLDDLNRLNRRWHTGYKTFEEVPFPEDIAHPAHRSGVFFSFDPWLAEYELRAAALTDELAWVAGTIRELDPLTPTCLNPPDLYRNHAELGYDFAGLASTADVLGASVHAPWHLGFSERSRHPALVASAIRMLRQAPGAREVELTEVQLGNVYYGSPDPYRMTGPDIAASYLAPLLAGAASVTGWCLNSRRSDFEAGDWALLDDDDRPGERSAASRRVSELITAMDARLGRWQPGPPEALVLFDERSQAVNLTHSWTGPVLPGRAPNDAIQGVGLLAAELLMLGVAAAPSPLSALAPGGGPQVLVASQLTAYDEQVARLLLSKVAAGDTLVIDGTTGHKDLQASVHRPWPGGLGAGLGFRVRGLQTRKDGHPVAVYGAPAGRLPLVFAEYEFGHTSWQPDDQVTASEEAGRPLVWRRPYGDGQVILFAGPLGPALVADPATRAVARRVLDLALPRRPVAHPLSPDTVLLAVGGEAADAIGVIAPASERRGGGPLRVRLPAGRYDDLWSGRPVEAGIEGTALLPAPEGIALLVSACDPP